MKALPHADSHRNPSLPWAFVVWEGDTMFGDEQSYATYAEVAPKLAECWGKMFKPTKAGIINYQGFDDYGAMKATYLYFKADENNNPIGDYHTTLIRADVVRKHADWVICGLVAAIVAILTLLAFCPR